MTEGVDGSLVDARNKEGGGPTGAEAVCFNAVRRDVSEMVDSGSGMVQFGSNVTGSDVVRMVGGVIVVIKGTVR